MFKFSVEQKIFKVGQSKVGGQPGELPTVAVGSIFYKGMREVSDHKKGLFDNRIVLENMRAAEEYSAKVGVPHWLNITAITPEAMRRYVDFAVEHSENPLLIGGAAPRTRIAGLEAAREIGVEDRTVLNAISADTPPRELEAVKECRVSAAVVLAFNEDDFSPEGRVSALSNSNHSLLKVAEAAGVRKILVDTLVYDVPSIVYAAEAVKLVKAELGYPAGCSPANAIYELKKLREGMSKTGFAAAQASANTAVQLSGADFLIYGSIKHAMPTLTTCAINDALLAYNAKKKWGVKPEKNHPLYKIYR